MFVLSVEQEKMASGGSVFTDVVKVAELIAPQVVKANPVIGTVATVATGAGLVYSTYQSMTSDPAAEKAAQEKLIQNAVQAEIKRIQEQAAREKQDQLDEQLLERRSKELQNKRSEEDYSDFDSFAGGFEVNSDFGNDWSGGKDWSGGSSRYEMSEDSYFDWA